MQGHVDSCGPNATSHNNDKCYMLQAQGPTSNCMMVGGDCTSDAPTSSQHDCQEAIAHQTNYLNLHDCKEAIAHHLNLHNCKEAIAHQMHLLGAWMIVRRQLHNKSTDFKPA